MNKVIIMDFLKKYEIEIENKDLLLEALTHSSYSNEHSCNNYERLEYLGDAVLELIVSDYLFNNESINEGSMTKKRASYVCEEALATYSREVGFIPFIRVGHGQIDNINDTIIADIFEAILGVIYLEKGLNVAKKYINEIVIPHIKNNDVFLTDYKSALQENIQTDKKTLEYVLVDENGPAHDKTYTVEVRVDDMIFGRGTGKSKKEAEQMAAKDAFKKRAK
jgi:ribonuclease-3